MNVETETRKQRSDEEWKQILLDYEQSDIAVSAVLEKYGIVGSMLYNARTRFKLKHKRGDKRNTEKLTAETAGPVAKKHGARYSQELVDKATALYDAGETNAVEIARQIGMGDKVPAVAYWLMRHRKRKQGQPARKWHTPPTTVDSTSNKADVQAAIALLRKMDKEITRMIRQMKIERADNAHLLGQMALRMLTGD